MSDLECTVVANIGLGILEMPRKGLANTQVVKFKLGTTFLSVVNFLFGNSFVILTDLT